MSTCFSMRKRNCRRSRVADENMANLSNDNGNRGYSGASFRYLWSFIKALIIHKDSQPSPNSGEEDEGGRNSRQIYGERTRNIWFANNPAIEEMTYLAVQRSMRYVVYM